MIILFSNSLITFKNINDNSIDIENQIEDINSFDLTLKFNEDNLDLLFHSKVTPYNLRIGRAMTIMNNSGKQESQLKVQSDSGFY